MFKMSRQADYGIVLLSHYAREKERVIHSARDLADETGLPLPMVSKILKGLAREDILESQRGVKGGYRLARDAEDISVAEVITALEGPIGLTECIAEAEGECDYESDCPVRSPWQKINRVVREALENVSLAEMVHDESFDPSHHTVRV